jgi:arsenical pump membrane protein
MQEIHENSFISGKTPLLAALQNFAPPLSRSHADSANQNTSSCPMMSAVATLAIILAALVGMLVRPFGLREAAYAMAGAVALVLFGLMPLKAALRAAGQGWDVALFLTGMMMLAQLAAQEGVFDWAACLMARAARGSPLRLFTYVYALAVLITVFLSNDATAVVFTPAVAAVARQARVAKKQPYLLICAFVANAASFLLPISNPANLVVYGAAMPALPQWLRIFLLPSVVAILATFLLLWATQAKALRGMLAVPARMRLEEKGRLTLAGLIIMALLLLLASGLGWHLGPPTFCAGAGTLALVLLRARQSPWPILRGVSWGVLFLVAGLFIMLGALEHIGLTKRLTPLSMQFGPLQLGVALALLCNLVNNLPAGLLAGHVLAGSTPALKAAALIAVDLGPNLSMTGSLATLLWLHALHREAEPVTNWCFLRLGAVMMPAALILALYALRATV